MKFLQILENQNLLGNLIIDNKLFNLDEIIKNNNLNQDNIFILYDFNFKKYLSEECKKYINDKLHIDIDNLSNIEIKLITSKEYEQYDEEFANKKKFIDYVMCEINNMNKYKNITEDILLKAGFINITMKEMSDYYKQTYNQDNYSAWRILTTKDIKDPNCLKLDIDNGLTNSGRQWHLHIDNNDCESIGSADIDTIWQFNKLMEIFDSKFRL